MTFGLLDSWLNYPERPALYPVSVRHIKHLPPASFRFPITQDTLAFSYKIPVIMALEGLGIAPAPFKIYCMPGTPIVKFFRKKSRHRWEIGK
jgi:hypothetical protein